MTGERDQRLIVVLGMHRSGTSALTRWLQAAGVVLGDHLLPPGEDNPTGFWEDSRIVALNDRVLGELDLTWHSVAPVELDKLSTKTLTKHRKRACKLLENLTANAPIAAFKDPRTARLLPFWQPVFDEIGVRVEYLVVVRHPRSVVESLERRHGFSSVKSELLWLGHTLPAIPRIWDARTIVVDFDRWIDDTPQEVRRVQAAFHIPPAEDLATVLDAYRNEFLAPELRHSRFPVDATPPGDAGGSLVPSVWRMMSDLASDRQSVGDDTFRASWHEAQLAWASQVDLACALDSEERRADGLSLELASAQRDLDVARQDAGKIRERLEADQEASREHAFNLTQRIEHSEVALNATRQEAEALRERLEADLEASRVHAANLTQRIERAEADLEASRVHAGNLTQRIEHTEAELERVRTQQGITSARLRQSQAWSFIAMEELRDLNRKHRLARQHASNLETTVESIRAEMALTRRDADAARVELAHVMQSTSWRATRPIRLAVNWVKGWARALRRRRTSARTTPLHDVEPQSSGWHSTGDDPQFLLEMPSAGLSPGWILFNCRISVPEGLRIRPMLYLDLGEGFSEQTAKPLPEPQVGRVSGVLAFPPGVRRIRFDPVDGQLDFRFDPPIIRQIGRLEAGVRMAWLTYHVGLGAGLGPKDMLSRLASHWRTGGLSGVLQRLITQYRNGTAQPVASTPDQVEYFDWIERYDRLDAVDRATMRREIASFSRTPVVSIAMPVFNTPEALLRRSIESVIGQVYPAWELCIADDASTNPQVRSILQAYAKRDARIKVTFRKDNGHISAATNSAFDMATGEFIALLDHDDELAPHALYMVALELQRYPDAHIIYSDEDKIDEQGKRFDPHFKPDWNPDLFLSQNYISHLGVYRAEVVRDVGGMREGLEGSQDYDLCLRCAAKSDANQIRHIPHVLYHWRAIRGSTALAVEEKSYPEQAAIRALEDHLKSIDPRIAVETGTVPTTYRIVYPLPDTSPLVSLIVPTRNGYRILKQAVDSILKKTIYPNYEIVIVDNQSDDSETLEYMRRLEQHGNIRVLRYDHPFNFSAINNFAVRQSHGELVGLINNDVEVIEPGWLDEMVRHALRSGVGAVGAKLLYGNGQVQQAGIVLGIGGVAGHGHKHFPRHSHGYFSRLDLVHNVGGVTAACLLVRKSTYDAVGGLNERALKVAFNDVDFCLRLLDAGYRNVWTPYALLYHHESISRGPEDTPEKQARFRAEVEWMQKHWGPRLLQDPAYNPNLTLEQEDFSLAVPPRVAFPWRRIAETGEAA